MVKDGAVGAKVEENEAIPQRTCPGLGSAWASFPSFSPSLYRSGLYHPQEAPPSSPLGAVLRSGSDPQMVEEQHPLKARGVGQWKSARAPAKVPSSGLKSFMPESTWALLNCI